MELRDDFDWKVQIYDEGSGVSDEGLYPYDGSADGGSAEEVV